MFTLRERLALVNMAVLLIALLLVAVFILNQLLYTLYVQIDRDLEILSRHELGSIEIVNEVPRFGSNSSQVQRQLGAKGFVRLIDQNGQITAGVGAYQDPPFLRQSLVAAFQETVFNQTSERGTLLRVYTLPIQANERVIGYLQVADDLEALQEAVARVRRSLVIGAPLILLISGLLSLLAARQALLPLTKMTHSATKISTEALAERLPVPKTKDEVQALAHAFNATLDRLLAAFIRQRRFTANASHELRNPVTAILGQAELALSRPRTSEAYQKTLQHIQDEAERMQRLIRRMLSLARLESESQPLTLAPTDIAELLRTLADTFQPQAAAKGVTLTVDAPSSLILRTDADSLTQILLNLLDNAVAYTDQGHIDLKLTSASDHICLDVSDTGPGITTEHLPHIFQPFYRVDPSHSQQRGNVGLGLALTYELVQHLGGTIEVTSQPDVGTTFRLSLPDKRA